MINQPKQRNLASAAAQPVATRTPLLRGADHRARMQSLLRTAGMLPVLLVLCIGFGFLTDGFF
ncbi:TPA: ribose ABC transporter permease, partial [Burkholderia vietnamiensis]|nr:ribose ABC transporter permease [Burkholderia vietnamiensis]